MCKSNTLFTYLSTSHNYWNPHERKHELKHNYIYNYTHLIDTCPHGRILNRCIITKIKL